MSVVDRSGTFMLGDKLVRRLGYGAMHLSGPGIFGPPILAHLRENLAAVELSLSDDALRDLDRVRDKK
jgi:hypothetical protein